MDIHFQIYTITKLRTQMQFPTVLTTYISHPFFSLFKLSFSTLIIWLTKIYYFLLSIVLIFHFHNFFFFVYWNLLVTSYICFSSRSNKPFSILIFLMFSSTVHLYMLVKVPFIVLLFSWTVTLMIESSSFFMHFIVLYFCALVIFFQYSLLGFFPLTHIYISDGSQSVFFLKTEICFHLPPHPYTHRSVVEDPFSVFYNTSGIVYIKLYVFWTLVFIATFP